MSQIVVSDPLLTTHNSFLNVKIKPQIRPKIATDRKATLFRGSISPSSTARHSHELTARSTTHSKPSVFRSLDCTMTHSQWMHECASTSDAFYKPETTLVRNQAKSFREVEPKEFIEPDPKDKITKRQ